MRCAAGGAGRRPRGGGHTFQFMITFALLFLLTRMGLWQLLALSSLATTEKDLGVRVGLSQSHALTMGHRAGPGRRRPSDLPGSW